MNDFTVILHSSREDQAKSAELLPLIYGELRKLAQGHMSRESSSHTLQATALVHEAWLRLVEEGDRTWKNHSSFFSAASTAMRRILVDHARGKAALKRGGDRIRLDIEKVDLADAEKESAILVVDEALELLVQVNAQRAKVVELKFFGGMTSKEAADTLGISESSVNRHWACARAWLFEMIRSRQS